MKRALALLIGMMMGASVARAGDAKIEAVTATSLKGKPTTVFTPDTPEVFVLMKINGVKKGDKLRAVWVADDVGDAAPANTKVGEKTNLMEGIPTEGDFSCKKPANGWPAGKYHVDIYANDDLATTARFTIAAAAKTEAAEKTEKAADGKVSIPYNDPTFTLELPAKWTFEDDKDGNVDCDPGDDSGYVFSILILKSVTSQKELKAALPKLARAMAGGAKVKNLELGDIETDKNGNGVSFSGIRGDGKFEGIDFVVMVHGFEPEKGKFYAIASAGTKEADAQHEEEYDAITASIEPLE